MKRLVALAVVGALVTVATPASAGCTTAYVCTWDKDADGQADLVWTGTAGVGATVTSTDSQQKAVLTGPFTTATGNVWYVDEDGDGDYERVYIGGSALLTAAGSTGGYASVYMIDRDEGDVVDYLSAVVSAGGGPVRAGYSVEYSDSTEDTQTASPTSYMSLMNT